MRNAAAEVIHHIRFLKMISLLTYLLPCHLSIYKGECIAIRMKSYSTNNSLETMASVNQSL